MDPLTSRVAARFAKTAAVDPSAQRAFESELREGMVSTIENSLNEGMSELYELCADVSKGSRAFPYQLARYKPLSMTDAAFADDVERAARLWAHHVRDALKKLRWVPRGLYL